MSDPVEVKAELSRLGDYAGLTVSHPDFRYTSNWRHGAPGGVVVFEKARWKPPTPAQVEAYESDAAIVRAHGGCMVRQLQDIAGEFPRYTQADCDAMEAAVVRDLGGGYGVVDRWNGVGCWTFSVAIATHPVTEEAPREQ